QPSAVRAGCISTLACRQRDRQASIRTLVEPLGIGLGAVGGPSSHGAAISVAVSLRKTRIGFPRAEAQNAVARTGSLTAASFQIRCAPPNLLQASAFTCSVPIFTSAARRSPFLSLSVAQWFIGLPTDPQAVEE